MLSDKIVQLRELQAKAQALEAEIEQTRVAELAALPQQFGYSNVDDFVKALRAAVDRKAKGRRAVRTVAAVATPSKRKKGKRTRLSVEQKKVLLADLGSMTVKEAAKKWQVSEPTVYLIKKNPPK